MKERESNCVTDMIREIRLLEEENQKLKKELGISEFNLKCYIKDLKERIEKQKKLEVLMLKTINIFEVALELKEVKSKWRKWKIKKK